MQELIKRTNAFFYCKQRSPWCSTKVIRANSFEYSASESVVEMQIDVGVCKHDTHQVLGAFYRNEQ
jgi:hypothetical protein